MTTQLPVRASEEKPKLSGTQLVSMVTTLEAFVVALAASEAKTRPDPVEFIKKLRFDAIEAANRFARQDVLVSAEVYADDLIDAIAREAEIELPETRRDE